MKNILLSLIVLLGIVSLKAQPNIQKNIYLAEKYCSDSIFPTNFYLAHTNGVKYSTFPYGGKQYFAKLDANYDTLYTVAFKGNLYSEARQIVELPNGNILMVGTTESYDNGYMFGFPNRGWQTWLMELDTMGNFIKAKTFGGLVWNAKASITSDGYILVTGTSNGNFHEFTHPPNGGGDFAWVAKYDTAFNKVWIKIFDTNGNDTWPTIQEITPSRYMVGFQSTGTDADAVPVEAKGLDDMVVHYIDSSANTIWKHRFGSAAGDVTRLSAVDPITKDVYFVGVAKGPGGDISWFSGICWVQKVDTFGNNKGSKSYGGTGDHFSQDALWFNGNLWIFSYSAGNTVGDDMEINTGMSSTDDSWIAVIDTNVNLIAKYTLQSTYNDYIYDAFIDNNEIYATGDVGTAGITQYKCDTANNFKFVFKLGIAPLGINEKEQVTKELFIIYPNPTDKKLFIKINEKYVGERGELVIFDIEGKTVFRQNIKRLNDEKEIDCSTWKAGNYVVQLVINKSIQSSKKFTKQ
jgi:hypothetical protein